MPKALVVRYGAYGDMIMITPVIKKLKELGYYVILNTSQRGKDIFELSNLVDEFIYHDDKMPVDALNNHWDKLKEEYKPDKFINFTESIECNVAMHPINPEYIYPKKERFARCNKNYYDVTEEWAGITGCQKLPILWFAPEEEATAKSYIKEGKFNVLWQLSGSGKQKIYPWTDYVIGELIKNYPNTHVITTGDLKCQLLESITDENITNLAGRVPIRVALALTKYVDLVISPDTGMLHASGCYSTPKIGLLGHTNKENITKYFINDYSLEADCACAPCFRLVYEHDIQCPVEPVTRAAWCMSEGLDPFRVYNRIVEVINAGHKRNEAGTKSGKLNPAEEMSNMRS